MERNPTVRIIRAKEENIRIEKVGIYARVSTAGRAQLRSLATQISGLTRHVSNRNDWLLRDICSKTWSKKTISTILTNAKYTGNVQVLKSDPGRNSYCMWNAHEAIISREDFAQVQKEI